MKEITLRNSNKKALVDDKDYERLCKHEWWVSLNGHVFTGSGYDGSLTPLHSLIFTSLKKGQEVDHIDRNPLNNQISNLRAASLAQQAQNRGPARNSTTGYKGVCYRPSGDCYEVSISCDGVRYRLGRFKELEKAVMVYNEAARNLHKEFAYINPLPSEKPCLTI